MSIEPSAPWSSTAWNGFGPTNKVYEPLTDNGSRVNKQTLPCLAELSQFGRPADRDDGVAECVGIGCEGHLGHGLQPLGIGCTKDAGIHESEELGASLVGYGRSHADMARAWVADQDLMRRVMGVADQTCPSQWTASSVNTTSSSRMSCVAEQNPSHQSTESKLSFRHQI